ncbi:hypothetical protein NPIL_548401 [Nephila pilipes]|uniref:Methylguanine DNA methyltransferase ribonuclease-like domain-containing protein n=1 Tax=Nephila pilipes TaxID=299642 RepID=A0A8X6PQX6_NEPPI|nr:hypothetical protein NPIL_548401 [Nephila pilipes]
MNLCNKSEYCIKSPIGNLKILYCERGIHSIENVANTVKSLEFHSLENISNGVLKDAIQWLKCYFESDFETTKSSLPLICPTVFMSKVAKEAYYPGNQYRDLITPRKVSQEPFVSENIATIGLKIIHSLFTYNLFFIELHFSDWSGTQLLSVTQDLTTI